MVPRPSSPKVGVSLLSSPVGFAMRSDDEKTIHELRDMLGNSMAIRERIEGEKLVRRVEKEGEEDSRSVEVCYRNMDDVKIITRVHFQFDPVVSTVYVLSLLLVCVCALHVWV